MVQSGEMSLPSRVQCHILIVKRQKEVFILGNTGVPAGCAQPAPTPAPARGGFGGGFALLIVLFILLIIIGASFGGYGY